MAEDRVQWCEAHAGPEWSTDEPIMAARYYHGYLHERLPPEERKRFRC